MQGAAERACADGLPPRPGASCAWPRGPTARAAVGAGGAAPLTDGSVAAAFAGRRAHAIPPGMTGAGRPLRDRQLRHTGVRLPPGPGWRTQRCGRARATCRTAGGAVRPASGRDSRRGGGNRNAPGPKPASPPRSRAVGPWRRGGAGPAAPGPAATAGGAAPASGAMWGSAGPGAGAAVQVGMGRCRPCAPARGPETSRSGRRGAPPPPAAARPAERAPPAGRGGLPLRAHSARGGRSALGRGPRRWPASSRSA